MKTIEQCRKILDNYNKDLPEEEVRIYTDEEIIFIRDFLYKMAKIKVDFIKQKLDSGASLEDFFNKSVQDGSSENSKKRKKKEKDGYFSPEPRIFKLIGK